MRREDKEIDNLSAECRVKRDFFSHAGKYLSHLRRLIFTSFCLRDLRSGAIEEPCISQLTWRLVQFRPLCGPGVSAMLKLMLSGVKCDFDQYVTVVVGALIKS